MRTLDADVLQGFVGSILAKRFDGSIPTPAVHHEWWELCTGPDRFVAIAAPRGFAKSTAITFSFTLAAILFRERQYILLISDTESQAVNFLNLIKQELNENEDIRRLFQLKLNEKGTPLLLKDSEADLIGVFSDGMKFRIQAKGSEQKLRGLLWNGQRPDLIVCDDMENDEIVMNKDRRDKFKRWFYGALLPSRSKNGIIRYVGTILHMDSMLENLMPVEADKSTVKEDLKMYSTKRSTWKSIKYRACDDNFEKALWAEKMSCEELKHTREDYRNRGLADVFSQEYFNIPIDETIAYFKKGDFVEMRLVDYDKHMLFHITCDLAISGKQKSDYSVFIIAGVDEERVLYIRNVIRLRLDGREIVDTLLALQRTYNPEAVGIEEGQISKAIGPFLYEEMQKQDCYVNLLPLKHMSMDKETRSKSIQARVRAHGVKFDKQADWYQVFEDECRRFPRDKHDDQVDAFSYLGIMLNKLSEAPDQKERYEMDYIDEKRRSDIGEEGRSDYTGY